MSPVVLHIAVSDYLRFEVSHTISLGSGYTIWKVSQFNGPAEPMTMVVQGDRSNWSAYILRHILAEIENYGRMVPDDPLNAVVAAYESAHINVRTYSENRLTYEGVVQVSRKNNKLATHELLTRFQALFDLFTYMA